MYCVWKHAGHLLVNTETRHQKYLNISNGLNTYLRNYQTTQLTTYLLDHKSN
jgi:hypothetical protein